MKVLHKALVGLAGGALIALVISVTVPRAVHSALVAALVRDVDNSGRHAFSGSCTATFNNPFYAACTIPVPAGEEAVIQYASFATFTDPSVTSLADAVSFTIAGNTTSMYAPNVTQFTTGMPPPPPFQTSNLFYTSFPLASIVDASSQITCSTILGGGGAASEVGSTNCVVTGYYVTLP